MAREFHEVRCPAPGSPGGRCGCLLFRFEGEPRQVKVEIPCPRCKRMVISDGYESVVAERARVAV